MNVDCLSSNWLLCRCSLRHGSSSTDTVVRSRSGTESPRPAVNFYLSNVPGDAVHEVGAVGGTAVTVQPRGDVVRETKGNAKRTILYWDYHMSSMLRCICVPADETALAVSALSSRLDRIEDMLMKILQSTNR